MDCTSRGLQDRLCPGKSPEVKSVARRQALAAELDERSLAVSRPRGEWIPGPFPRSPSRHHTRAFVQEREQRPALVSPPAKFLVDRIRLDNELERGTMLTLESLLNAEGDRVPDVSRGLLVDLFRNDRTTDDQRRIGRHPFHAVDILDDGLSRRRRRCAQYEHHAESKTQDTDPAHWTFSHRGTVSS